MLYFIERITDKTFVGMSHELSKIVYEDFITDSSLSYDNIKDAERDLKNLAIVTAEVRGIEMLTVLKTFRIVQD